MGIWELLVLAAGLSMDAFAVSVCKGLSVPELKPKHALITGLYFGGFQALMPLLGYLLGRQFEALITNIDHWIAFVLLTLIGKAEELNASFRPSAMLPLAVATSIDALAVGVTLAFLQVNIGSAVALIGVTTFLLSAAGVKIGHVFGLKFKAGAEIAGGVVLILNGRKRWRQSCEAFSG